MDSNMLPSTSQHPHSVPQSSIPASSVPQIRSRITVVCAECKRLKLKCDRRNPCGSCTKRDTVARCVYSPAAAEKVDLHSLNNRLIQVESTLAIITSGQIPPVFQSSYPFSQPSTTSTTSTVIPNSHNTRSTTQSQATSQHQHHHHQAAPSNQPSASISVALQDLSSIWLDELDLVDCPNPCLSLRRPLTTTGSKNIKTESSASSELIYNNPHIHDFESQDGIPARPSSVVQNTDMPNPELYLPPLRVYYPPAPVLSSGNSSAPCQFDSQPHTPSTSYIVPQPSFTPSSDPTSAKPTVTPSLVALLPPIGRSRYLLQHAYELLRVRPIASPTCLLSSLSEETTTVSAMSNDKGGRKGKGKAFLPSFATRWDSFEVRALCLIGGRGLGNGNSAVKADRDRREKERFMIRAREIFFGNGTSSPTIAAALGTLGKQRRERDESERGAEDESDSTERCAKDKGESLPFFATVCMALALGVLGSKASEGAIQVPTPAPSPTRSEIETSGFFYALAQQVLGVWESHTTIMAPPSGDEKEGIKAEGASEEERLDYLIACLLGVEYMLLESSVLLGGKDREKKRKKNLNAVFPMVGKMVNVARAMGLGKDRKSPLRCKEDPNGRHRLAKKEAFDGRDTKKKEKIWERRRRKDELRRLIWWDVVHYDLFISDVLGHPSLVPALSYSATLPRYAASSYFDHETDSDDEDSQDLPYDDNDRSDLLERYHGARCRLTQFAHMIKYKIAHPDCCCGYTLDQAAALEGDVRRFLAGLPHPLRSPAMEDDATSQTDDPMDGPILRVQSCELTILAQRLIIMAYLPFLRPTSNLPSTSNMAPSNGPASSNSVDSIKSNATWNPALQSVVNASQRIIQASSSLLQPNAVHGRGSPPCKISPTLLDLYPVEKALLDAVIICTHASIVHAPLFASNDVRDSAVLGMELLCDLSVSPEYKKTLDRLKGKFRTSNSTESANALVSGVKRKRDHYDSQGGDENPGITVRGSMQARYPSHPSVELDPVQQQQSFSGQNTSSSRKESINRPSQLARNNMCDDNFNEKCAGLGDKGKKQQKRGHIYPSVGIRVRPGKDAHPFTKWRTGSVPVSDPHRRSENGSHDQENTQMSMPSMGMTRDKGEGFPQQIMTPESDPGFEASHQRQQHKAQMDPSQPAISSLLQDASYRSRLSSLNQDIRMHSQVQDESVQAMDYAMSFENDTEQRFNVYEQQQQGFAPPATKYNPSPRPGSFDIPRDGDQYRGGSFDPAQHQHQPSGPASCSPYTNGDLSSSSSPYAASGNVMPPTPTFGRASQNLQPSYPDSHTYYHVNSGFDNAINHTQSQGHYTGLEMAAPGPPGGNRIAEVNDETDARRVGTSPMTNTYGKGPLMVYDMKAPLDGLVQQHIQQRHPMLQPHQGFTVNQSHIHMQHPIPIAQAEQGWQPPLATAQEHVGNDESQRYWATPVTSTGEFKYYS